MSSKSRWANEDPEEEAIVAQRKREKEEKRRAKAEKQRLEQQQKEEAAVAAAAAEEAHQPDTDAPPKKRRRLSNDTPETAAEIQVPPSKPQSKILRFPTQEWGPSRHVDNFERLNHIEEGSYGWVSRAKDITTGEIVALKKLKMDNSPDGFPVTGLREIQTLLEARHPNIVYLREIVVGTKMDEYVSFLPSLLPMRLTRPRHHVFREMT
jgi:cell division cycle 2-like protein